MAGPGGSLAVPGIHLGWPPRSRANLQPPTGRLGPTLKKASLPYFCTYRVFFLFFKINDHKMRKTMILALLKI